MNHHPHAQAREVALHAGTCLVVGVLLLGVAPLSAQEQPQQPAADSGPAASRRPEAPDMEPLWALYKSGRFAEAASQSQQLLKEYPDHQVLHHLAGRAIVDAGHNLRAHEAIEHLKRSMNGLPPEHWMVGWSHFYIGYAYETSGRPGEAIESYQMAIAANSTPECTNSATAKMRNLVHAGLASALEKMEQGYAAKDYQAVLNQGHKFLKRPGSSSLDDPLFFHLLGRAGVDVEQKAQLKEAVAHLNRSLELKDGRTWIEAWNHYYLGSAYAERNQLDQARTHLQKAIELNATVECTNSARVRLRHLGRDPYEGWQSHQTDHFVLRYPPDSDIAERPDKYTRQLEKAHRTIRNFLHLTPRGRITFYLYNDARQGREITGQELGWADRDNQIVHQHIKQTLGHEMTHCLSHFITRLDYCDSVLVNEGLAVYLDQTGRDKHATARRAVRDGTLPTFSELERSFRIRDDAYPLAGSFVGYLLENYSVDFFRGFWRDSAGGKHEQAFRRHYHKTSDQLSVDWTEFLRGLK